MKSFTLSHKEVTTSTPSSLSARIDSATGSERDTASILRSLERIGTDPSILFYEMTQETRGARYGGVISSAWRVRADRGVKPEVVAPEVP